MESLKGKAMLIYTGGGFGGALADVPARDLTLQEVEKYGGEEFLLSTGLYTKKTEEKRAQGGHENKLARGGADNKAMED